MILSKYSIFDNIEKHITLSDVEKEFFYSLLNEVEISKKDVVLRQDQLCKKLFFVESGSLRAFNLNKAGKESTIMFAVKDWWVTDMDAFMNQKQSSLNIEALEDSVLLSLAYHDLEILFSELPQFEKFFRILFQNAYIREQRRALHNISMSTEERYQQFLDKYPKVVAKITQKQIASYLGVTPEFLSSIKKK